MTILKNNEEREENKIYIDLGDLSYPARKSILIIKEMDKKGKLIELNKIVSLLDKIKNKCC